MEKVVIFGAGNQGRVALAVLRAAGRDVQAFIDDGRAGTQVAELAVWSREKFDADCPAATHQPFIAIGNNDVRRKLAAELRGAGYTLANAIHPSAVIMPTAKLGSGLLICPQAFVGVDAVIGDDAVINTNASVDHDCVVVAGAYIAPGVVTAGAVTVGERSFVGLGAKLGPNVNIGAASAVGAGAVVLKHVPAGVFVAGTPARFVNKLAEPVQWGRFLAAEPKEIEVPE